MQNSFVKILLILTIFVALLVTYNYYSSTENKEFYAEIAALSVDKADAFLAKNPIDKQYMGGYSLLALVAELNKNPDLIKYLIEHGAQVNSYSKDGMTALMSSAALNSNQLAVQYLVEAGADINALESNDMSAFLYAVAYNPNLEVAKYLVEHGANIKQISKSKANALILSTDNPNPETIDYILSLGFDINQKNEIGVSPLMYASYAVSDLNTIRKLIDLGADINAQSNSMVTPLMYAVHNNNPAVIEELVNQGANLCLEDIDGLNIYEQSAVYDKANKTSKSKFLEDAIYAKFRALPCK